jgi:hypothetical protein
MFKEFMTIENTWGDFWQTNLVKDKEVFISLNTPYTQNVFI